MNKDERIQELEKKLEEINDSLTEAQAELAAVRKEPEPRKAWVHDRDKYHWSINPGGSIRDYMSGLASPLNSFPNKATAQRIHDWLCLIDKLRIAADGYEHEVARNNYYLYTHTSGIKITDACTTRHLGTTYFPTREAAQTAIDSLTPEEVEVFKRGSPVY